MDTVTQALLGSAVAFAVAGRKAPRRSVIYGALLATLPDLDVFIPYGNDLEAMIYHRSWSHSWIVQTLLAPLFAWLISRLDPQISLRRWVVLIWLVWITHSALDAMTVYGTQLFWPFMPPPASIGSIFIIDPLYTLPLLAGFLAVVIAGYSRLSKNIILGGLVLSTSYLGWSFAAQQWIAEQTRQALSEQQLEYQHIKVTPAPLNTLLWRIVVIDNNVYYEAFRSVFDGKAPFQFHRLDRGMIMKSLLPADSDVDRLRWFTQDNFKLEKQHNLIVATDLRMGMEPTYFFRFQLAEVANDKVTLIKPQQLPVERDFKAGLQWVWQRIWNHHAELILGQHPNSALSAKPAIYAKP